MANPKKKPGQTNRKKSAARSRWTRRVSNRVALICFAAVFAIAGIIYVALSHAATAVPDGTILSSIPNTINSSQHFFICSSSGNSPYCLNNPGGVDKHFYTENSAGQNFGKFRFEAVGAVGSNGVPFNHPAQYAKLYGSRNVYLVHLVGTSNCLAFNAVTGSYWLRERPCNSNSDQWFVWLGRYLVNIGATNYINNPPYGAYMYANSNNYSSGIYFKTGGATAPNNQWGLVLVTGS